MYTIKESPKDFLVKERISLQLDGGHYAIFKLKKTNYNTLTAIAHIAAALQIPSKTFGFAGNKDKKAITEQFCSVKDVSKDRLEKITLRDIEIEFIGNSSKPISLGDLAFYLNSERLIS